MAASQQLDSTTSVVEMHPMSGWSPFVQLKGAIMLSVEGTSVRLEIPLFEAVAFAMGWTDLGQVNPTPALRRLVGELAAEGLEYIEEWRVAARLRQDIATKWGLPHPSGTVSAHAGQAS